MLLLWSSPLVFITFIVGARSPESPDLSSTSSSSLPSSPDFVHVSDNNLENDDDDDDDRTLLDAFGEAAKEYLTQHVIPPTDSACAWDWRTARCEPSCRCALQYQFGDFHLGRSCRGIHEEEEEEEEKEAAAATTCEEPPPDTAYSKVVLAAVVGGQQIGRVVKSTALKVGAKAKHQLGKVRESVCVTTSCRQPPDWKEKLFCGEQIKVCRERNDGREIENESRKESDAEGEETKQTGTQSEDVSTTVGEGTERANIKLGGDDDSNTIPSEGRETTETAETKGHRPRFGRGSKWSW